MCLIIAPGKDGKPALLPRDVFDYAFGRNKDGFGGMWVEDGRVKHFKTLGMKPDEAYAKAEALVAEHPEAIFHLRMKTHGQIVPGLAHPFRILSKGRHGKDLFFMHNGVFGGFGDKLSYGQSDTTNYKDKVLIPLLTRDPDALDDPAVWAEIEKQTSGSRLVFMDSEGNTKFTNEKTWNDRYGLTLSNDYMLPFESKAKTPKATTTVGAASHAPYVTSKCIYNRMIDRNAVVVEEWCSCPKPGYVRTGDGRLYKDYGPNRKIYHVADYIEKAKEFAHLGLSLVPSNSNTIEPFDDDDLPDWEIGTPSKVFTEDKDGSVPKRSGPDPMENRLRYARLLHNSYANKIASPIHLVADLVGMNDAELSSLTDEDPEISATIIAELLEMVIHYNTTLWGIDPNHKEVMSADEILRIGQADYHRDAIQEITKIRRKAYEESVKKLFGDDDDVLELEEKQKA